MSLINEALKKAQRQRAAEQTSVSPEAAVESPVESGPLATGAHAGPPRRRRPAAAQTVVLLSVGAVLLLVCGGLTAFILFAPSPAQDTPRLAATMPATIAETTPAAETAATISPDASASPVQPVVVVPLPAPTPDATIIAPEPVPAPPVVAASPTPAPAPVAIPTPPVIKAPQPEVVTTSSAVAATATPPPEVAGSSEKPNPQVHIFLEQIRVAGIRASQSDPRVLMNDRMYRLNDMVDARLQLRLTGISNLALTFTDANGHVYTHNF